MNDKPEIAKIFIKMNMSSRSSPIIITIAHSPVLSIIIPPRVFLV